MRRGRVPEERIQKEFSGSSSSSKTIEVWIENVEIIVAWCQACGYWSWLSTGMGATRTGLDWYRLLNVTLIKIPKILTRPDLKKKKDRKKYIVDGLQVMEQAALKVFIKDEREKQKKLKAEQDRKRAQAKMRRKR